jgi:serine/arginine repetitive matrix protein 2
MMPPVDRDMNASGRASRASNMSAASRGSKGPVAASDADYALAPGVARMLRTSTDTGNLDGLMAPDSFGGGPNIPRGNRRGAGSRMSTASSQSIQSNRTSMHRGWPSQASNAPRHSRENNVPQYVPDTLSPTTMNIPGSSPYFPQTTRGARDPRNGARSFSMTMGNVSEPALPLSGNRSYNSLRSTQHIQRPNDSYKQPLRIGRSSHRSPSPAWSEPYGGHSRRGYGYGSQNVPLPRRPDRLQARSDMSLRGGPPLRSLSPVYYGNPHPDIPPVPPLVPHRHHGARVHAFERTRKSQKSYRSASHRSGPPSVSSGSTNRRADSDAPSSDATSPPTPTYGVTMGGFGNPTSTQAHIRRTSIAAKEEAMSYQEYSDYTEQFENEQLAESEAVAISTGYVHRMKGILEERGSPDPIAKKVDVSMVEEVFKSITTVGHDIAELPASPVPQRLTKELVRSVVGFASPTGAVESCEASAEANSPQDASANVEWPIADSSQEYPATASLQPLSNSNNRHSILSQTGSSVINSSTLEFAVQSLISMGANNGLAAAADNTGETAGVDGAPTTEDGMSDLLDGYQHTDVKQEIESAIEVHIVADDRVEKGSNHAAKSSDEQSFKSCTDLPETTELLMEEVDIKSLESGKDFPVPELLLKDSDAKSFKTCKDSVTPERAVSLVYSKLPLSRLTASEPKFKRPASDIPCSSPLSSEHKEPLPSASNPSMIKVSRRVRLNQRSGNKQVSVADSGSSSIRSSLRQPPVPPRESSSSKEAQHMSAVVVFLTGLAKAKSSFSRKPAKRETKLPEEDNSQNIPTTPQMRERLLSRTMTGPVEQLSEVDKMLVSVSKASTKHNEPSTLNRDSMKAKEYPSLELLHPRSMSVAQVLPSATPSPMGVECSSVYSHIVSSPESGSFPSGRIQPSPGPLSHTPEGSRHDSQTTTHLSWPTNKPLAPHPTNGGYGGVSHGNGQDETTATELRPAPYQKYTMNYLPDLKEESHEDSSLKTSASNLKHSNFRFPGDVPHDLRIGRTSVDDAAMFGRTSSVKSYRKSIFAKPRCLPSMEFSEMNLLEKLGDLVEHRGSRSMDLSPEMRDEFVQLERSRSASVSGLAGRDSSNEASSAATNISQKKRTFSPRTLKEEVENLNIPSVDGLTLRVSELMPSLRGNFREDGTLEGGEEFVEEESIMEHALEDIKKVSRPAPKHSIARLRPVPGSLSVVVTYDDLCKGPQQNNAEKASASAKELGEIGATKGRSWSVAHTAARDKTIVAELEAPFPTAVRARSLSLDHHELRVSSESRLSSRSVRTLDSTPTITVTDTRPWNRDENYPWATTESVDIDISLPRPAAARSSPRPGPSHLRHRLSNTSSASGAFSPDGTPGSPASPIGTTPAPGSTILPTHTRRESLKRWSLFVNPNKPPLKSSTGFDASGFATAPVHVRGEDQSHGAGDRYPTSALPLPSHLHLADSTSRLSDYTTDEDAEPFSSCKDRLIRKTRRSKRGADTRPKSSRAQEVPQSVGTNDSSLSEDSSIDIQPRANRRTFSGAEGMSRWTYLSSKFVYKVKTIYDRVRRIGRRSSKTDDRTTRSPYITS